MNINRCHENEAIVLYMDKVLLQLLRYHFNHSPAIWSLTQSQNVRAF